MLAINHLMKMQSTSKIWAGSLSHMRQVTNAHNRRLLTKKLKKKDNLEDVGTDGRQYQN